MPIPPAFQALIVGRVRELVARARSEEHYAPVRLAAFLYAAASWVHREHPSGRHALRRRRPTTLAGALAALEALPLDKDPYDELVDGLLAIETELTRSPGRTAGFPSETVLDAVESEGSAIAGVVRHAIRPASRWRAAREARGSRRGPMDYARRVDDLLDRLVLEWRPHPQVGRLEHDRHAPRAMSRRLGTAWDRSRFRVALCPLRGELGPRFHISADGVSFTSRADAVPVSVGSLDALLAAADREHIVLLLLPELHLRPEEVAYVSAWLAAHPGSSLAVIAAGSGHTWAVDAAEPHNAACLMAGDGRPVWVHHKKGLFRVTRAQVETWKEAFAPVPEVFADELVEGIACGTRLMVLDTEMGRLALAICADLLDPDGFVEAIRAARPAFLLLVSMSPETDRFVDEAARLAQLHISTLYVNATTAASETLRAFVHLALHGGAELPPTQVRWAAGKDAAEGWWPGREWEPLPADSPFGQVVDGLGLVVDLYAISQEP